MRLGSMTWKDLEEHLDAPDPAAVLVPLGAVEAHGPHLPLDTDTIIAVRLAEESTKQLSRGGIKALCAPPIPITAASWAADFAGTLSLPEDAERGLLRGVLAALRTANVARVAFVNLHFDPVHMDAVKGVVEDARKSGLAGLVFPDFTRRRHAQRVGGEFASGACHGGEFETSLCLAAEPKAVQSSYKNLPRIDVDLAAAIRAGKKSFREVGLSEAYCGNPAAATAAEGKRLYNVLAEIVAEECAAIWNPKGAAVG